MPSPRDVLNSFAVVILTGGSSGIGKSFIELGQKLSPDLVFCNLSRRIPPKNIFERRGRHFPCDLAKPADLERAAAEVGEFLQREVPEGRILLINNSGFGTFGRFPEPDLTRQLEMIDLNARAVVHLTGLLLPTLRARGGAVMTIASVMGFLPTPFSATYGATKAFALHWTVALNEELRGTGVQALAVCPGTTRTEFFREAGLGDGAIWAALSMSSEDVALRALRALGAGRSQVVTGWKNKVYTFAGSKIGKPAAARISGAVLGRFRLGKGAP